MPEQDSLQAWLDTGQHWLARVQAAGLSCAGHPLLAEGHAWRAQGELLGWAPMCRLLDLALDEQAALSSRARALLDLVAWVATARRLEAVAGSALKQLHQPVDEHPQARGQVAVVGVEYGHR